MTLVERRVWRVYRLYTRAGVVEGVAGGLRLYVGKTSRDVVERFAEHAVHPDNGVWWPLVDHSLTRVVVLNGGRPTTSLVSDMAERAAICEFGGTLANNKHNGGRGKVFVERLRAGDPCPVVESGSRIESPFAGVVAWIELVAPAAVIAVVVVLVSLVFLFAF